MNAQRRVFEDRLNAFCKDSDAYLQGSLEGPLRGLKFAAKDILDVEGHVTGGGNPDWKATHQPAQCTAWAIDVLVKAGATMVGKTHTDELTRGIWGENVHYGTPTNPRAKNRVPGGSSSGSAVAVAGGIVDFALGSDTGGSMRIPASFCGLYGIRPTHGRIPLQGVLLHAPSYDTLGWFTRDPNLFAQVGYVLLQSQAPVPQPRHLVIATDIFKVADKKIEQILMPIVEQLLPLFNSYSQKQIAPRGLAEWTKQQSILCGREASESIRNWIDNTNPRLSFSVIEGYLAAKSFTDQQVKEAQSIRRELVNHMNLLLTNHTVVCLPTAPSLPSLLRENLSERRPLLKRIVQMTCIAGTLGMPQINLPLAEIDGIPIGLSLIGARGSDEMLITFASKVANVLEDERIR